VGVGGALWNSETAATLRELADVVQEAATLPERSAAPRVERHRKPGWAAPLVRAVLEDASEPMTAMETDFLFKRKLARIEVYSR